MASSDLNLNSITFQSQLRDKPVRENFTDIQSEFNSLRSEFQVAVASTATEVTNARDNFGALQDNLHIRRVYGERVANPTDYQVSVVSGLTVQIGTGSGLVNGVGVSHATTATASVSAPVSGSRYDIVSVNTDNTRSIIQGTATTGTPQAPTLADTQMPITKWVINATTATLGSNHITDLRTATINPFQDFEYYDYSYNYTGSQITSVAVTDRKGDTHTFTYTYSGGKISTIAVTIASVTYTYTYTYSGSQIASAAFTIS